MLYNYVTVLTAYLCSLCLLFSYLVIYMIKLCGGPGVRLKLRPSGCVLHTCRIEIFVSKRYPGWLIVMVLALFIMNINLLALVIILCIVE